MIVSTGNKPCSGREFLNGMAKRLKFGTSLEGLLSGPSGLNAMIECSTSTMARVES